MTDDPRLFAPATARNRDPIWTVLAPELPTRGLVLEIAAGSGEHSVHFARLAVPTLHFQPTDPDASARASIDAWAARSDLANVKLALALDAASDTWPVAHADAVLCINMVHISPWQATEGLIRGGPVAVELADVLCAEHARELTARPDRDIEHRQDAVRSEVVPREARRARVATRVGRRQDALALDRREIGARRLDCEGLSR